MALKVIVHDNISQAESHAQAYFRARREMNMRRPHVDNMDLYGIAQHTTRYPIICDDCGETYWANDPYAEHIKCRKGKAKAGF
jgi:hypothetical protein